jgi:hypothetical protein
VLAESVQVDALQLSTCAQPSSEQSEDAAIQLPSAKALLMDLVGPVKACTRTRKRKAERATILTASPYKKLLESKLAQQSPIERNSNPKSKGRPKTKGNKDLKETQNCKDVNKAKKKKKQVTKLKPSKADRDDVPCSICQELFYDDNTGRQWIQCQKCMNWNHNECQGLDEDYNENSFICISCDD